MSATSKYQRRWTDEEIFAVLRDLRQRLGRIPSAGDLRNASQTVQVTAIRKRFGTWENALSQSFPRDPNEDRQVLIGGTVHLYDAKAPFEESGKSLMGALELSVSAETMKCHECGEFVRSLANHVKRSHGIAAREYKQKHGLKMKTALVLDHVRIACSTSAKKRSGGIDSAQVSVRMKQISMMANRKQQGRTLKKARPEIHNGRGRCRVQTLEKVYRLGELLGHTPSIRDLTDHGVRYWDIHYHFGTIRNAQMLAGMDPNNKAAGSARQAIPPRTLIQHLRIFFYNNARLPRYTDVRRGLLTFSEGPYRRCFGTFGNAIKAAFTVRQINKDGFWKERMAA